MLIIKVLFIKDIKTTVNVTSECLILKQRIKQVVTMHNNQHCQIELGKETVKYSINNNCSFHMNNNCKAFWTTYLYK